MTFMVPNCRYFVRCFGRGRWDAQFKQGNLQRGGPRWKATKGNVTSGGRSKYGFNLDSEENQDSLEILILKILVQILWKLYGIVPVPYHSGLQYDLPSSCSGRFYNLLQKQKQTQKSNNFYKKTRDITVATFKVN